MVLKHVGTIKKRVSKSVVKKIRRKEMWRAWTRNPTIRVQLKISSRQHRFLLFPPPGR
jgi:hypothetical protein